jgi:hypothetical protein
MKGKHLDPKIFLDINTNHVWKFLRERMKPYTDGMRLRSSAPQLVINTEDEIEAGYYQFEVDGLIFDECWIEPYSIINRGVFHKSGSYYVRTK